MTTLPDQITPQPRVWQVSGLCHALADALEARFNPVTVTGEISGFARASSGHCYFSLKDSQAQIRCAMFRRAASLLNFQPKDGDQVQLRGRITLYEQRGDLQLVVESLERAGQGVLLERFLQLKAKLEQEGLFDAARKRPLPLLPRAIGVVTSLGAAALHDVVTALRRRVPHIPVVIAPAQVQGASAATELIAALNQLYGMAAQQVPVEVILLVRGGGSLEDLWCFNDEALVRCLAQSPVPVVSGIGHETDFTLADFCADLRAPTPTAAAELCAQPQSVWLAALAHQQEKLDSALTARLDRQQQRLDWLSTRLGRPQEGVRQAHLGLMRLAHQWVQGGRGGVERLRPVLQGMRQSLPLAVSDMLQGQRQQLDRVRLRLELLDPKWVLRRGYAWLENEQGQAVSSVAAVQPGQTLRAILNDGKVDLSVTGTFRK